MKKTYLIAIGIVVMLLTVGGVIFPVWSEEKEEQGIDVQEEGAIARAVVGTGVEDREPTGVAETFPSSTEKVYCFIEMTHIPQDTEVAFVWFHDQEEMLKTHLPLKMGPKWRTYAYKNLYGLKGDWKIEIQDDEGNVIKEVKFKVVPT